MTARESLPETAQDSLRTIREYHAAKRGVAADPSALAEMLGAREARWKRRLALSKTCPALISMTLCVPLPYRTDQRGKELLRKAAHHLATELLEAGFAPGETEEADGADGLAVFLPCGKDAESVKRFCVHMEEMLPYGRILDLDVTKEGGTPVGRAEIGLPPRSCFLCGRPAAECVAGKRHTPPEVAAYVENILQGEDRI